MNSAEDLPEDAAYGIRIVAITHGARRCLRLASGSVGLDGPGVMTLAARRAWQERCGRPRAVHPRANRVPNADHGDGSTTPWAAASRAP